MRLFNEEVHVTLTNSNCNYITVESYEEIFFDVFEIEFGGKKYITEKVGTHNGFPVISIPVSENNRTVEVEFVLKEGHTSEVLFNKSLAVVQKDNYDVDDSIIVEGVEEESSVDEIEAVLLEREQSDKIREGILRAKESGAKFVATAYADRIIKEKMNSLESSIDLKYANLQEYVNNAKAALFEDFVKLVDIAKESITSSNQRDKEGIESSVRMQLSECILALESSLTEKQEEAVAKFDVKLTDIANEVLTTVLLPEVSDRETKIKKSLSVDIDQRLKNLHESFNAELVSAKSGITILEKINVEITDSLKKSSSKIDLVEKSLHTKLKEASKQIQSLVESETGKVTEYYNRKIESIEKDISDKLTSADKEEIIALVESSKQSIVSELASTQRDIPNIIIEKANGSKELNVNKLKSEVEKSISTSVTNKFSTEIQALKRLVEMSSGGGSVAKQFANGGTMNGNLTVVGAISASSYLGLVIPNPDLSQYLPLSGGTVTGDLDVVGKISATSNIISTGHFLSNPSTATAGHFLTKNGTTPTIAAGRSAWFSSSTGDPQFKNGTSSAVTLVRSTDLGTNVATFLATPSSANLLGAVTDETGNGLLVFNNSPTIHDLDIQDSVNFNVASYNYGTGSAALHRTALGLTTLATTTPGTGVATFLATPSSANLLAALTTSQGTGSAVFATSPTITTPTISRGSTGLVATFQDNNGASATVTTDSFGRNTFAVSGKSGAVANSGAYVQLNGYEEAWTTLNVLSNTSGQRVMRFGTLSNRFSIQRLNDAINSITATPFSIANNAPTNSFYMLSSGFVGIGTSSPALPLSLSGSNANAGMFRAQNASANGYTGFELYGDAGTQLAAFGTGNSMASVYPGEMYLGTNTAKSLRFYTTSSGNVRMSISATGEVGIGNTSPSTKAVLDLTSTTQGFLPPRMTTAQRDAITSVPAGLMIYNISTNKLNFYNGSAWEAVTSA